jgi:WD40 repeat protein
MVVLRNKQWLVGVDSKLQILNLDGEMISELIHPSELIHSPVLNSFQQSQMQIQMQEVTCVCALPDPSRVVSSSWKTLRIWNLLTGICERELESQEVRNSKFYSAHLTLCFSSSQRITSLCALSLLDGIRIVSGSADQAVSVWNISTGQCDFMLRGHVDTDQLAQHQITHVCPLADGFRVVSGSYDGTLCVWNVSTGECERVLRGHSGVSEIGSRCLT